MKIFIFGLLIGSALAGPFRNYNVNYDLTATKGYQGNNRWGSTYQANPGQFIPATTYNGQQQIPLSYPGTIPTTYHGSQYNAGQQQMPLSYPGSVSTTYHGSQYNAGQQQMPLSYPGNINAVGQQQMPLNYPSKYYQQPYAVGQLQGIKQPYNPYGNQTPVHEEWIVPAKATFTYQNPQPAGQMYPIKTVYNSPAPVKTTYHTK